jgi:hypothetical protein
MESTKEKPTHYACEEHDLFFSCQMFQIIACTLFRNISNPNFSLHVWSFQIITIPTSRSLIITGIQQIWELNSHNVKSFKTKLQYCKWLKINEVKDKHSPWFETYNSAKWGILYLLNNLHHNNLNWQHSQRCAYVFNKWLALNVFPSSLILAPQGFIKFYYIFIFIPIIEYLIIYYSYCYIRW